MTSCMVCSGTIFKRRWRKLEARARLEGRLVASGKPYASAVADVMISAIALRCVADDGLAEEQALSTIIADVADGISLAAQRRIERAVGPLIENRARRAAILAAAGGANQADLDWHIVKQIVVAMMQVALHASKRRMTHAG